MENTAGAFACSDMFDNDNDMLVDCADPDCASVAPCTNVAPTMSPGMIFLLAVTLALVGLLSASRVRRGSH
jgi:hypothetical protein